MTTRRFVLLDGLRGVAAIGVVLTHVCAHYFPVVSGLYLLVDFFFVLSGFVLEPLMPHEGKPFRSQATHFIYKRLLRFLPMVLVVITFRVGTCATWSLMDRPAGYLCAQETGVSYTLSFISAALLLQILVHSSIYFSTPLWSLSAEWFSNLVLLPLTSTKNRFVLPVALICGQILLIAGYLHTKSFEALFSGYPALGRAVVGFVFGLLMRRLFDKRSAQPSFVWMLLACASVVGLFIYQRMPYPGVLVFAPPIFAFLVFQAARAEDIVNQPQVRKVAAYFGLMSFGVYAWHENIRLFVAIFQSDFSIDRHASYSAASTILKFVLVLVGSVLATQLTIRYVESPIQRRFQRRISRQSSPIS